MSLFSRAAPMIGDPLAALTLGARWQRTRSLLLVSSVALPVVLTLVCVALATLTALSRGEDVTGGSIIPVLAAGACTVALIVWLRRDGLCDPQSWVPATMLMTGSELVLGVIPGFGFAARHATGIAAKALLATGVLVAAAACAIARLARRSLVASPVAELGSTGFLLVLGDRRTRLVIGAEGVEWTTRQGRSRFDGGVWFDRLDDISTVEGRSEAVVLHTESVRWTVPIADAIVVRDILRRRKALWDNKVEAAAVTQERIRRLTDDLLAT